MNSVITFYDDLADGYHLIFADWEASILRQAGELDRIIRTEMGDGPLTLLDCACGIGTQSLGLAGLDDYTITASDISPQSIERLKREAAKRNLQLDTHVADMRTINQQIDGTFDVVIAFDNAIPHLLTDDDLRQAAQSIHAKVRPGGLFAASIRDYDQLIQKKPEATSHRVMHTPDGKRVSFQLWDWRDDLYDVTQFIVRPNGDNWSLSHTKTTYRALQRQTLSDGLADVGFTDVRWQMPSESGFYQPVVLARR